MARSQLFFALLTATLVVTLALPGDSGAAPLAKATTKKVVKSAPAPVTVGKPAPKVTLPSRGPRSDGAPLPVPPPPPVKPVPAPTVRPTPTPTVRPTLTPAPLPPSKPVPTPVPTLRPAPTPTVKPTLTPAPLPPSKPSKPPTPTPTVRPPLPPEPVPPVRPTLTPRPTVPPPPTPTPTPTVRPTPPPPPQDPPAGGGAGTGSPDVNWASKAYNALRNLQARAGGGFRTVKLNPRTAAVQLLTDGSYPTRGKNAEERARNFLAEHGAIFTIPPDLSGTQYHRATASLLGDHVTFTQTYAGIPVLGGLITVHTDTSGNVFQVSSGVVPNLKPRQGPTLTKAQAMEAVNRHLGRKGKPTDTPRITWGIHAGDDRQTQAWEIWFKPDDKPGIWRYVVDAIDGTVLAAENRIRLATYAGQVFDPHPIKSLDTDPNNPKDYRNYPDTKSGNRDYFTADENRRIYFPVTILANDSPQNNELVGQNVEITPRWAHPTLGGRPAGKFDYKRGEYQNGVAGGFGIPWGQARPFQEQNAYYWIDQIHRYLEDPTKGPTLNVTPGMGIQVRWYYNPNFLTQQIKVNVYARETYPGDRTNLCCTGLPTQSMCSVIPMNTCLQNNAYYDPAQPSLHFYPGGLTDTSGTTFQGEGVDFAEDVDVVLHEYAHAIEDAIFPDGCCYNDVAYAMSEGFADYQGAMYAELRGKGGRDPAGRAQWSNAVPETPYAGQTTGGPRRRLDNNFNMSANGDRDLIPAGRAYDHYRGQAWAAALWDIKRRLGFRMANRAIYNHLYLRTGHDDTFELAANRLIQAHAMLDMGLMTETIKKIFYERGILPVPSACSDDGPALVTGGAWTVNRKRIDVRLDRPVNQQSVTLSRAWSSWRGTGWDPGAPNLDSNCFGMTQNVTVIGHFVSAAALTGNATGNVTLTVTLRDSLKDTAERPAVRIVELADANGCRNRRCLVIDDTQTVRMYDGAPPEILWVGKSGAPFATDRILVRFSEPMDGATVNTTTTWRVSGRNPTTLRPRQILTVAPDDAESRQFYMTVDSPLAANEVVTVSLVQPVSDNPPGPQTRRNYLRPGMPTTTRSTTQSSLW